MVIFICALEYSFAVVSLEAPLLLEKSRIAVAGWLAKERW